MTNRVDDCVAIGVVRYDLAPDGGYPISGEMEPDPIGPWVRWDDYRNVATELFSLAMTAIAKEREIQRTEYARSDIANLRHMSAVWQKLNEELTICCGELRERLKAAEQLVESLKSELAQSRKEC